MILKLIAYAAIAATAIIFSISFMMYF